MEEENVNNPNWETPTALKEMPELMPWEAPFVQAFYMLTNSRQVGMGLGPLQLSEIRAYCELFGCSDVETFVFVMQRCDNAYLNEHNKQQESKKPKK